MVPDLVLICENMLMAEGFVQAKTLASKFHGLYSLLQELLSKQVKWTRSNRFSVLTDTRVPASSCISRLVLDCARCFDTSAFFGSFIASHQDHYDWGMRAVKSVLVVAGKLKRAEPDLPEDSLLMRALRDFNTPKIVHSDEVRVHAAW